MSAERMRISDLILSLEAAKREHGDLPVFTFGGPIAVFELEPCIDGLDMIHADGRSANEVVLEIEVYR